MDACPQELRISCSVAQMEVLGGVSPVVSPLAQVREVGRERERVRERDQEVPPGGEVGSQGKIEVDE